MRLIDADRLCEDLLNRWNIADTKKEELIRQVMADIVTPIVVSQPTIEPQKWIPCSERMPEDYTRVLTTNSKIGAWEVDINSRNVAGWIYSSDPVAWCPLPEPWKEEEE